jgi:hypothetical protein
LLDVLHCIMHPLSNWTSIYFLTVSFLRHSLHDVGFKGVKHVKSVSCPLASVRWCLAGVLGTLLSDFAGFFCRARVLLLRVLRQERQSPGLRKFSRSMAALSCR